MSAPPPHVPPTERALLESVPDVVYRYRVRPTPGFEYVSPSSTAVTGYTPEEHYADPDLAERIVHPDDMSVLRDATERPDPSAVYRIRWRHKDGHELVTEQRLQPICDRDGNLAAIVGVARPVTSARDDRIVAADGLMVDLAAARAFVAGRRVELTTSEHRILALLASVDRAVSREELVEHLWGSYHAGGERAVQVHVSGGSSIPTRLIRAGSRPCAASVTGCGACARGRHRGEHRNGHEARRRPASQNDGQAEDQQRHRRAELLQH
jgi:PAS domain S-box-containing protein